MKKCQACGLNAVFGSQCTSCGAPQTILITERQAVELVLVVQGRAAGRTLPYEEARDMVAGILREQGATPSGTGEGA